MNYLTLDEHKHESIHSGATATFSIPVFFTPAFSSLACFFHFRVFHSRVFSRPVIALGIRTRGPGFDSGVVPLFHWVTTLGKSFTHIAFPVSQLQETGAQRGSFRRLSDYGD